MPRQVQALVFDIFGTVVDWYGSIADEVARLALPVDGGEFALAWRAGYAPAMQEVRSGALPWTHIDALHRRESAGGHFRAESRHAGLPWDAVLSAELFGHYKPDPEVYLGAARLLDLPPSQLMMVAAHPSDLRAAAACGLRTALIPRPLERGPGGAMEPWAEGEFDIVANGIDALAEHFGV